MFTRGRSLSKLTITSFQDEEMTRETGSIEVDYNPVSIDLGLDIEFEQNRFFNDIMQSQRLRQTRPQSLQLELLLDAALPENAKLQTVNEVLKTATLEEHISAVREMCCTVDPGTRTIRYLKFKWGNMKWRGQGYFAGRVTSMSVRYTLFARDGKPLRASVRLNVMAGNSDAVEKSLAGIQLPRIRTASVEEDVSLPRIAALVQAGVGVVGAGAATMSYLDVALANDMGSLDDYAAGDRLVAPVSE